MAIWITIWIIAPPSSGVGIAAVATVSVTVTAATPIVPTVKSVNFAVSILLYLRVYKLVRQSYNKKIHTSKYLQKKTGAHLCGPVVSKEKNTKTLKTKFLKVC